MKTRPLVARAARREVALGEPGVWRRPESAAIAGTAIAGASPRRCSAKSSVGTPAFTRSVVSRALAFTYDWRMPSSGFNTGGL
jgi:hypothetical protein